MIAIYSKEAVRIAHDELDQGSGSKSRACDRLDSWKEIAAYFRRSVVLRNNSVPRCPRQNVRLRFESSSFRTDRSPMEGLGLPILYISSVVQVNLIQMFKANGKRFKNM
jgi:hypothetical protein